MPSLFIEAEKSGEVESSFSYTVLSVDPLPPMTQQAVGTLKSSSQMTVI